MFEEKVTRTITLTDDFGEKFEITFEKELIHFRRFGNHKTTLAISVKDLTELLNTYHRVCKV